MKRLLAKIGRFFWSWGFLKFTLWTVTLIALFYAEEDWRGARDWAQTKAKWEAKGESFDFDRLIPATVPANENLAAIPLFRLERDSDGSLEPITLRRAVRENLPVDAFQLPNTGSWQQGKGPDYAMIQEKITGLYEQAFHAVPLTNDPLVQLEAIYPFIAELRASSVARPSCRFLLTYASKPPFVIPTELATLQLWIARVMSLDAVLALHEGKADLAFADVMTMLKLASGLRQQPNVLNGLCAIATTVVTEGMIVEGLALHAWNDDQLAMFEDELSRVNFLADYQLAISGELMGISLPSLDYFERGETDVFNFPSMDKIPWPRGWFDQNKCGMTNGLLSSLSLVRPETHRAFPEQADEQLALVATAGKGLTGMAPWRIFSSLASGPLLHSVIAFTRAQVWADQTRIALALERYWLVHHAYPATLAELAPTFIAALPHDVIDGEPYRYRLRPDGRFLLYSVGWNRIDEGGLVVSQLPANAPPDAMRDQYGDWVWPVLR